MVQKFDNLENSSTTIGAGNSDDSPSEEKNMGDKTMRACACVAILALMLAVAAFALVVIIIAKPSILM